MTVKIRSSLQIRNKEKYFPFILLIITMSIPFVLAYFLWNPDLPFTISNFLHFLLTLPAWAKNNSSDAFSIGGILLVVFILGLIFSIKNLKNINAQMQDKEIMCIYLNDDNISFVGRIDNNSAVKTYSYSEIERVDMLIRSSTFNTKNGRYEDIVSIDILFKLQNGSKIRFSPFGEISSVYKLLDISNKVQDFDYQISCDSSISVKVPLSQQIEFYIKNGKTKTEFWYAKDVLKIFGVLIVLLLIENLFKHYFFGF
jgi:hypothetical protein